MRETEQKVALKQVGTCVKALIGLQGCFQTAQGELVQAFKKPLHVWGMVPKHLTTDETS